MGLVSRTFILLFGLSMASPSALAAISLDLSFSRIHGLVIFLDALAGDPHQPPAFKEVFDRSRWNQERYREALAAYRTIRRQLQASASFELKQSRVKGVMLHDLYITQSGFAENLEDLAGRTLGLLPVAEHRQLISILKTFEPVHEDLIWREARAGMPAYLKKLQEIIKAGEYEKMLQNAELFYLAKSGGDGTFAVRFHVVPQGSRSMARSYGSFASVGVLLHKDQGEHTLAVTLHELCHTFYAMQEGPRQKEIDGFFAAHASPSARLAYSALNEGLATAIGNGWSQEKLRGRRTQESWYDDKEIDAFAHGLYPHVTEYLDKGKPMDAAFMQAAVKVYEQLFPDAHLHYRNILTRISLWGDSAELQPQNLVPLFLKHFRLSSADFHGPGQEKDEAPEADLPLVIATNGKPSPALQQLVETMPILRAPLQAVTQAKRNCTIGLLDSRHRAIILIKAQDEADFEQGVKSLKKKERISTQPLTCE